MACEAPPAERRSAIHRLRADPTEQNVRKIRSLLHDPDRDVRATALNVLVGLAVPDAVALAQGALSDEDGFVRAAAAKLLGDTGEATLTDALAETLAGDTEPIVRRRAAEALGRTGGERATATLAASLSDPIEGVRLACIQGLVRLGPAAAREGLTRLVGQDPAWEVRAEAAGALGSIDDPEVVAALEAALEDPNESVHAAAAQAIAVHRGRRGESGG